MDTAKTGALIAEARREKGMTQRELAEALHVSDRTVSKWERGAGFPDVGLLEPLADALDLSVNSLLHGEKTKVAGDEDVRLAVRTIRRATAAKIKKNVLHWCFCLFAVALFGVLFLGILAESSLFDKKIQKELAAGVYVDGERIEDTKVFIDGEIYTWGSDKFNGRFAIEYVEKSCRDNVVASIGWHEDEEGYVSIVYYSPGNSGVVDVEYFMYMDKSMQAFALQLADGTIIATSEKLAELMALDGYYPLVWNTK